jgi:two-component system, OmpR family, osmolarity sensor histidine kinase EnvZ
VETECDPTTADALTRDLQVLGRIVDQFLAYVQGDSGARLGVDAPLHETVRQVVRQYALQGHPVAVAAEPVALPQPDLAVQRLLVNLIDNALAHGRAPVDVALRDAADGHGPALSVSDAGAGMSAVQFQQAQRPFVRLARSTTADGHCGLGLAIVAQLAAQLGATLSVDGGADTGRPFAITVHWPPPATV